MAPFISIIIPTRNRAVLARQAVACALKQSFADFEILVLENSDTPELASLARLDQRIRVVPSTHVLSMPDNWERAIDEARGAFLMFISDKDRLVPSALGVIAGALRESGHAIATYGKAWWDSEGVLATQICSGEVRVQQTAAVLREWFHTVNHLPSAPMVYNSAVQRELALAIRRRHGRFFWGNSPDVASSPVLMGSTASYLRIDRMLAVAHAGAWSIGTAAQDGRQGSASAFVREFGEDPFEAAGLVYGVPGAVAETLLACKRALPALFAGHDINWSNYTKHVVLELRGRERRGISTAADHAVLKAGAGRVYSRWSYVKGSVAGRLADFSHIWIKWLKHESAARYVFPPHPRMSRLVPWVSASPVVLKPDADAPPRYRWDKVRDLQDAFARVAHPQP